MNPITSIALGLAATILVSCKPDAPPAPTVSAPPVPATPTEIAKTEGQKALADAKSATAHAGEALKGVAGLVKEKSGAAWDAAKQKVQDFGSAEMNEITTKLEDSIRQAKAKGGAAWEAVKGTVPAALEKIKGLIASLPEDKKEAAKAKLQQLQDVLDGKQELPPVEAPAPAPAQ